MIICSPMESVDFAVTIGKMFNKKVMAVIYEPGNFVEEAIGNGVQIPRLEDNVTSDFEKQIQKVDLTYNLFASNTEEFLGELWSTNTRISVTEEFNGM